MIEIRVTEIQSGKFELERTGKALLICDGDAVTITIEQSYGTESITVDRREFLAAIGAILSI